MSEYDHLRGDPVGALQQIRAEAQTALDLDAEETHPMLKWPGSVRVLLEGLVRKADLGTDRS